MPAPRPRGFAGGSGGSGGRPAPNTPMSERQQMALLMQMTSSASPSSSSSAEMSPGGSSSSHGPARSRDRNERGETALHVAAIKGDQEAVKKLLDSGMSPNVTDFAGWTPLHEACNHAHYNVALTLVKAGANVNARGLDDDTPLHDAALIGHLKLVKMLVEKGADVTFKNRKGKTPVDVAVSSVSSFLMSARDAQNTTGRSSQQVKKPSSEQKKNADESDDSANSNTANQTTVNSKEEDDVYEFKNTPKDSSNNATDDKSDNRKNEKQNSDEKGSEEASTTSSSGSNTSGSVNSGQTKRSYSDVEGNEENPEGEDNKRKKRKDSDNVKEVNKQSSGGRAPQRQEKGSKQSGSSGKSISSIAAKVNTSLERKSPCASPKPAVNKSNDSDVETEDSKSTENFNNGGPKVPPLKIVIPQQNTSGDMDTGSRNGKSNSARSHAALPYVVASSSNSNDSLAVEKESAPSRCSSPVESTAKSSTANTSGPSEEKNLKATSEERAQQRVLRSSHRSGGQGVDRGSNNSSPQLQSNSPPPTPAQANESNENASSKNPSANNNSSPATQTQNQSENENAGNAPSPSASSTSSSKETQPSTVELHPRKRKIRAKQEESSKSSSNTTANQSSNENNSSVNEIHPHDHPFTNCYQMFLNIRKQIEKKHRSLFPIQPRPPQGFKDYLMNRRTYVLAAKTPSEPVITIPANLPSQMKELFITQEKERHKLKMQHIVEKEKLGLTVEQEILRVHGKAARSLACQSVPFSACTVLKDEEIYNMITPEQEEKDRNARSRYNGRLFLSWLQDVDDKWEKIKEAMVLRHHNEAESLHAVQKMDWEWVMKENSLCDYKSQPVIDESHVPMVHVSDDFDLLPA